MYDIENISPKDLLQVKAAPVRWQDVNDFYYCPFAPLSPFSALRMYDMCILKSPRLRVELYRHRRWQELLFASGCAAFAWAPYLLILDLALPCPVATLHADTVHRRSSARGLAAARSSARGSSTRLSWQWVR